MAEENLLVMILTQLCNAPDSQLSESYRNRAKTLLDAPKDDVYKFETGILDFFNEIYSAPSTEVSSFVQALVDPKYTNDYRTSI